MQTAKKTDKGSNPSTLYPKLEKYVLVLDTNKMCDFRATAVLAYEH